MKPPKASDAQFSELRDELCLWPELPNVTRVHNLGLAIDLSEPAGGGSLVVCCHDEANEIKHTLIYPTAALKNIGVDDPKLSAEEADTRLTQHARFIIGAPYN